MPHDLSVFYCENWCWDFTLLLAHAHVKFQICMDTHQYIPAQLKTDSPIRIFFDFLINLSDLSSMSRLSTGGGEVEMRCNLYHSRYEHTCKIKIPIVTSSFLYMQILKVKSSMLEVSFSVPALQSRMKGKSEINHYLKCARRSQTLIRAKIHLKVKSKSETEGPFRCT